MALTEQQQIHVLQFVDPNKSANDHEYSISALINDINDKKLAIEVIISGLGDCLTSPDDLMRGRGITLIAEVLYRVPNMKISPQNASTFAQFLAARLLDFPTVSQVVSALNALVRNHTLHYQHGTVTNPDFIVTALFNELHIPSLRQPVRKQVYEILNVLLVGYSEAMKPIARDFVVGVIQAIDMEKDPRNLLVSFELIRSTVKIIPEWVEFGEELFRLLRATFQFPLNLTLLIQHLYKKKI